MKNDKIKNNKKINKLRKLYKNAEQNTKSAEQNKNNAEENAEQNSEKNKEPNSENIKGIDCLVFGIIEETPGLNLREIIKRLSSIDKKTPNSKIENSIKRLRKKGLICFDGKSTKYGGYITLKKEYAA